MDNQVRILSRPETSGREVTVTWPKKLSPILVAIYFEV